MIKVPGRDIYCGNIWEWFQEVLWCYVVMKVFKNDIDAISCKGDCENYMPQEIFKHPETDKEWEE